jgi:hypothetical protein
MPFRFDLASALRLLLTRVPTHASAMGVSHLAGVLHILGRVAGLWCLISATLFLLLLVAGVCYRLSSRLRIAMIEAAGPLPAPLHDRRHRQRGRFRLRHTRRQLAPREGAMLESLNHAIDYLVQTYHLKHPTAQPLDCVRPAQLEAVELLLQKRAEMLAERPPMPSLASLLRRRIAYLRLSKGRV